jgi:type II secretory pathway pseudopilin PulG
MKIDCHTWFDSGRCRPLRRGGFTLTEMMIAMTVFVMAIVSLIAVHLFGMRMFELAKAKLGASDEARTSLASMLDEIRSNTLVQVGTGTVNSFVGASNGSFLRGNAIQIYPTNNPNSPVFVRYYVDTNNAQLLRISSGQTTPKVLLRAVTNLAVFAAEDSTNGPLTNYTSKYVISMFLQITQLYTPLIGIKTGGVFEYYQIRSKATPRL